MDCVPTNQIQRDQRGENSDHRDADGRRQAARERSHCAREHTGETGTEENDTRHKPGMNVGADQPPPRAVWTEQFAGGKDHAECRPGAKALDDVGRTPEVPRLADAHARFVSIDVAADVQFNDKINALALANTVGRGDDAGVTAFDHSVRLPATRFARKFDLTSMNNRLYAALLLGAVSGAWPLQGQRAVEDPLTIFAKMMPVLSHDRCVNCHGATDAFRGFYHPDAVSQRTPCVTCHTANARWDIAPAVMAFFQKTTRQLCDHFSVKLPVGDATAVHWRTTT